MVGDKWQGTSHFWDPFSDIVTGTAHGSIFFKPKHTTSSFYKREQKELSLALIITSQLSFNKASVLLLGDFQSKYLSTSSTSNMFSTPKRTNQEATSNYSIMCPPAPTRSTSQASLSSSLAFPNLSETFSSLDSFLADLDLSESRSPMKVDGFFLTPPSPPPSIPSLSEKENHHQGESFKLQPRSSGLSIAIPNQICPIELKPRPSHRRNELVLR